MTLVEPTIEHVTQLASWVNSQQQLYQWAGPSVRFPITFESLLSDLKLNTLLSYSLVSKKQELIAFGQCYERLGHCHLGRLIVSPEHRGKRIISDLISQLSITACAELNTQSCSLFVFEDNFTAIKAYQHNGFELTTYPAVMTLEKCLYMTKSLSR